MFALLLWGTVTGCSKEIEVVLPDLPAQLMVEGTIETGTPPFVVLSMTQGYFDAIDFASMDGLFLANAEVLVHDSGPDSEVTHELPSLCTSDLSEEQLPVLAAQIGLSPELLAALDLCVYTTFDPAALGATGHSYRLEVNYEGYHAEATTRLLESVPLDSLWFAPAGNVDSLGWVYATLVDPPALGDAYRWFAKRINRRPAWDPQAGEVKDADFIPHLGGSVFDDAFFNGLDFEIPAARGLATNSDAWDDDPANGEVGFFKPGDTVVVKFCTIDRGVFRSITTFDYQMAGIGNPFAIPASMESNVDGGVGLWAAYAQHIDTLVCE